MDITVGRSADVGVRDRADACGRGASPSPNVGTFRIPREVASPRGPIRLSAASRASSGSLGRLIKIVGYRSRDASFVRRTLSLVLPENSEATRAVHKLEPLSDIAGQSSLD